MQYFVYNANELLDILNLTDSQKDNFLIANPHFRLEECTDKALFFETEDNYYE